VTCIQLDTTVVHACSDKEKAAPGAVLSTAPIGAGTQKEMLARLYQIARTAALSL
jgi:hypothetical protein